MSNRAARRAANKAKPAWKRETKEDRIRRLMKNGITPEDLEKEYKRGWDAAINQTAEFAMKMIYCGFALALKREFGFGSTRVMRTLTAADKIILEELTTDEIIDRVARELGITMRFDGGVGAGLFE